MGLDITAHKNVKLISKMNWENVHYQKNIFRAFVIDRDWCDRISDFVENGHYISESSKTFYMYSYTSHSYFRQLICEMMGQPKDAWKNHLLPKHGDFEEFLNFADNEGCISHTTCKKLYGDFDRWKEKATIALDEAFFKRYLDWMNAFKFASENGAVEYH